jgi:hypothetical protein
VTHTINIWSHFSAAAGIRLIHKCMEMDAYGQVTLISSVSPCKNVFCITFDWFIHTINYVMIFQNFTIRFSRPATWIGALHTVFTPSYEKPKIWASTQTAKYAKTFHFLRAFAKFKKSTISFDMSVLLPVRPFETIRIPLNRFSWNMTFEYFSKTIEKIQFSLKCEKKASNYEHKQRDLTI